MKNIIYISICALLFTACDDYQEIEPRNIETQVEDELSNISGKINGENFYQGLHHLNALTNSNYDPNQNLYTTIIHFSQYRASPLKDNDPYSHPDSSLISDVKFKITGDSFIETDFFAGKNALDTVEFEGMTTGISIIYKGVEYFASSATGFNENVTLDIIRLISADNLEFKQSRFGKFDTNMHLIELELNGGLFRADDPDGDKLQVENLRFNFLLSMPEK